MMCDIISSEKIKGMSYSGLMLGIEDDKSKLKQKLQEQIDVGRKRNMIIMMTIPPQR